MLKTNFYLIFSNKSSHQIGFSVQFKAHKFNLIYKSNMNIPFHKPNIPKNINEIFSESIHNGWLTTGPQVAKFESLLCDYLDAKHVVAVNSCTAGLHLSLVAKGFKPGDYFIAPTYTFAMLR